MQNKVVHIRVEYLFPSLFRVLGAIILLVGLVLILALWWLAILLMVGGFLLLFSYEAFEISRDLKSYRYCYVFFYVIKNGEWFKYNTVDKFFIKSFRISQYVNTRVTTGNEMRYQVFKLFIKFDDGEKDVIMIRKSHAVILNQASALSTLFGKPLQDMSAIQKG